MIFDELAAERLFEPERPRSVAEPQPLPRVSIDPGQDDLTHLDEAGGELVNTAKVGALDEVLVQPPQDPEWRP